MRETQTYDIITDVARMRSEIGVLYLNRFNETIIKKALRDNGLIFEPLFTAKPHVFIGKGNPLAQKEIHHSVRSCSVSTPFLLFPSNDFFKLCVIRNPLFLYDMINYSLKNSFSLIFIRKSIY